MTAEMAQTTRHTRPGTARVEAAAMGPTPGGADPGVTEQAGAGPTTAEASGAPRRVGTQGARSPGLHTGRVAGPEGARARQPRPGGAPRGRGERQPRPQEAAQERGTRQPGATTARSALGRYGEDLAARHLTEAGMTILERNWRAGRTGEIDIIAHDSDTLVICEVKTRRSGTFQHPMAAVTPTKTRRLRDLAEHWLQEHGGAPPGGVRIDLVGILIPFRGAPEVEHIRGVS